MDGSYLDRWASWAARWLVAGMDGHGGRVLGAHYARLFPDRVRALVLEGPSDPQATRGSVVESQVAGFEAAFAAFADRCYQHESCVSFGHPRALSDRVVRTARGTPISSGRPVGDPPANDETVLRAVVGFLASPEAWLFLDTALREADAGDSGSLDDMIDSLEGKTPERREVDVDDAAFVVGCDDSASGPPAAPYADGVALPRTLGPSANLLTVSGGGHTALGRSPCVAEHVTLYLVELRVPGGQAC